MSWNLSRGFLARSGLDPPEPLNYSAMPIGYACPAIERAAVRYSEAQRYFLPFPQRLVGRSGLPWPKDRWEPLGYQPAPSILQARNLRWQLPMLPLEQADLELLKYGVEGHLD